jgi:Zn-dependent M28 family amino/carboxypeptidase
MPQAWSAGPPGWAACRSAVARCSDSRLPPFGASRTRTETGETMGKRGYAAVLLTTIALLCTPTPGASAAPAINTSSLREAVTLAGVRQHQKQFQNFADQSDGTREASTKGYTLSADYVEGLMESAGYDVTRQRFEYNFYEELAPPTIVGTSPGFPFTYTDGANISTMDYSGSGTVTGVVQGVNDNIVPLPVGQPDSTSNAGCEDADFTGFTGDIALIQRGTCFFYEKIANAVEAGSDAVIIFNEGNSEERSGIDFGQASFPQDVPVIEMSAEAGAALVEFIEAEAAADRQVTLTVTTSTVSEIRESENVIAQTRTGRTDRVVISGAHLDSVLEGPGINDNGSGSAGQLEVAQEMAKLGITPVNQVRFIWFGAEEAGLVGSAYYVSQLSKRELKNIAVMLNFDMIGSPNPGWFVYDGDASDTPSTGSTGSGVVEAVFVDFFDSIDRQTEPTAFDGRSDYDAFVAAGIPAGGLFTGAEDIKTAAQAAKWGGTAGVAFDPCYHQACDTYANVDERALDEMTDAMAHAILTFAMTTSAVQGTDKGSDKATYDPTFRGYRAIK